LRLHERINRAAAFWHHAVRGLSATTGHRRCFLKPAGQTSAGRAGSSGPLQWSR